ncbi:MAG: quinol:cytochrome c oxidoreductase quinone-binding subunit 2 [Phycisphaerales bacterium]|nr:quinol:cytochrome c oxidoreductase quinone-binding subunit 2 [Phycisphaerales bacterium]
MAHTHHDLSQEVTRMRPAGKTLGLGLLVVGIIAVVAAFILSPSEDGHRRFWFAYLFGLCAITAVSCASLIFTLINHLVRAGWITNVRRILETMALQTILVAVLTLPIIGITLAKNGVIYSWAKPSDTAIVEGPEEGSESHEEKAAGEKAEPAEKAEAGHAEKPDTHHGETDGHYGGAPVDAAPSVAADVTYPNHQAQPGVMRPFDENIARKNHTWLNPTFWSIRILIYVAALAGIAFWYWKTSVDQDATGDMDASDRMFGWSAPALIVAAFATTFIAFDMYMALDPHWFSTMFGVYYFASGTQAMWAIMALFVLALQSRGYLKQSVTKEHRHDLGKFLWAFIFFWGYIAFDQYMLQWYANLPEETFWFDKRGYNYAHPTGYTPIALALLIGRFIIPFLGLVSRHVKRNRFGLGFWAVWLLVFFILDMYHIVIPEYSWTPMHGAPEILAAGGIMALWLGNTIRVLGNHELRAVRDPRVHESLALQNF